MKILMLYPYAPLPPPHDLGGTKRNLPFLRENASRHEVSVISFGTPHQEQTFRAAYGSLCKEIIFVDRTRPKILSAIQYLWLLFTLRSPFLMAYRRPMQETITAFLSREHVDVVHCCAQMFGFFRFPAGTAAVSDTHEVTYDLLYRSYQQTRNVFRKVFFYLLYRLGKPAELRACRTFDALVTTTERDAGVFRNALPGMPVYPVSNGVDPSFLSFPESEGEPNTLVFTGKMDFYPNIHGLTFFLDLVFPLILREVPDARVLIVGAHPSRELRQRAAANIEVTGFVDDVRPYIARGQVFVIPLLIGGGIRGKALEAMAMRRPIVTTAIGCESIHLENGTSALFADGAQEFADAAVRLLRDPALRNRLAAAAHQTVLREYDWQAQGRKLQDVYEAVKAAKRPPRAVEG